MPHKFFLDNLLEEGERLGIPKEKKRALIREYLQSKIIYYLYAQKGAHALSFMDETCLRLLRNLDRFSEDLDFDNLALSFTRVNELFSQCVKQLAKEDFRIEFTFKKTNNSGIGSMKFIGLLSEVGISSHREEKLIIKIDYAVPEIKPDTEVLILNRFGLVQSVITNTQEFILAQKMRAVLTRKDLQARDFYDVVWLLSRNIRPSSKLFKELGVKTEKELYQRLLEKYQTVKSPIKQFKQKLEPFLIYPQHISYLDVFGDLMKTKIQE